MERLTYKQIKEKVGESWALIYNPIYSQKTGKLLRGELIGFSEDKDYLALVVEKEKRKNLHFSIVWFGEEVDEKILLNFF